jgi:DNA-binding GntR family transcriptional regulator
MWYTTLHSTGKPEMSTESERTMPFPDEPFARRAGGQPRLDDVYSRLRDDLLSLRLIPGERLSERALERRLGVSRTPIRWALLRLEEEGLVRRGDAGLQVSPIDLDELLEAFEFREQLECQAARLACRRASPGDLDRLQSRIDAGLVDSSPQTWFEIGTDIHVMLAEISGNRFIRRAVRDAVTRIARARWLMAISEAGRLAAHREHSEIVSLIRQNRPDAAAAALALHIRIVRDNLVAAMNEGHLRMRASGLDLQIRK